MTHVLAVMVNGHWRPGIGDPTVLGWVTTVMYFIATGLCAVYALRIGKRVPRPSRLDGHRAFWWCLTVFMLLMSINKQLDLQVLILQVARQISLDQGWSTERIVVRKWMVVGSAIVGLILTALLVWAFRRTWRRYALALFGLVLLGSFVLIRASGGDVAILGHHPGNFPMFRILEIGGIVCVGAAAWTELRHSRKQAR
ncbi:MAG: hypothetical protein P8Z79_05855 [Sedimentisphaerales bacterium]|jgi:hypothetical protein